MTLAEMREEVMSIIGMSGDGEEARVDSWINRGVKRILTLTSCEVQTADVDLDVDEGDYESDEDIIRMVTIHNLTDSRPLDRVTVQELEAKRLYGDATGGITCYASPPRSDTLMFYPTPDSATQLRLYYVPKPRVLDEDANEPDEIPDEWHDLVVLYALGWAADWDDDTSSSQGQRYRADFKEGIKDMKRALLSKAGNRLAPARVNPRGRSVPFSDPSRTLNY